MPNCQRKSMLGISAYFHGLAAKGNERIMVTTKWGRRKRLLVWNWRAAPTQRKKVGEKINCSLGRKWLSRTRVWK